MDNRRVLHELLYISVLEPSVEISAIVALTKRARSANKDLDITGVLIFDGERFCQYLEGGIKNVVTLFNRITLDVRHTDVQMLHQGTGKQRRFMQFNLGFAYLADVDVIGAIALNAGPAARDSLLALQDSIDFGS